ncbi:MAG: MBL fold metallo-hydrolase [Nitrososphaeria archaeon]|jgi:glyoxylase-like metal-dependent hydrolase (beta-lactamase superfamily II)
MLERICDMFMKLDKVSQRVYVNTEGKTGANVGIIVLDDFVIAVDSQYPVSGAEFRRSISNVTSKPVRYLLLTHYHQDHVFGSWAFKDCKIVGHSLLKKRVEENLKTVWSKENLLKLLEDARVNRPEVAPLLEGLEVVLPNVTFEGRFTVDGVEMIHTGGHSECSSIVYVPDDRVLFAGDLLFAERFPWGGDPTANPDAWISGFRKILKMDVRVIVPGHGSLSDKGEVRKQLDWFTAVRSKMKEMISKGVPMEEVVGYSGYPSFYEPDRPAQRADTLEHWYRIWSK